MNRNRTFRYLFSEEGDVYLPDTRVLLVELPFDVDQYELGPCVDPQIDIDNPEHVISKTPVNVLGLLEELAKVKAENAALLAALEGIASEDLSGYGHWTRRVARVAIAKAKRGEG